MAIVGRLQLNKHNAALTKCLLFREPISLGQMLSADKQLHSGGDPLYSVSASSP